MRTRFAIFEASFFLEYMKNVKGTILILKLEDNLQKENVAKIYLFNGEK